MRMCINMQTKDAWTATHRLEFNATLHSHFTDKHLILTGHLYNTTKRTKYNIN